LYLRVEPEGRSLMGTSREWNLRMEGLKLRVEGLKGGARRLEPESERIEA
jgi:hypothetical protein